ncbi:hypothetical protein ACFX14_035252 [Malus domestica]
MESGGGSASGSLGKSQLSRKKSFAMSHEDSSNPEGYGLVLYLRLSCGGGGGKVEKVGGDGKMSGDNLGPLPVALMCELENYALVPADNLLSFPPITCHTIFTLRNNQWTLIVTWAHADQRQTGFLGRAKFILQLVRKSSRPTSRHPEYHNWRNIVNQPST